MLSTVEIQNKLIHKEKYRKCFSKLTLEEIAQINEKLFDTLVCFDKICRENNLTYMLVAGALIGAVRDGRCIPWDDDIDLIMPRKDYEKIGEILKKSQYKKFTMSYPENGRVITMGAHFYNCEIKLEDLIKKDIGESNIYESYIYLDILPLDYCPDNRIQDWLYGHIVDLLQMSYTSRRCFKKNDSFLNYLAQDSKILKLNITLRKIISIPLLPVSPKRIFKVLKYFLNNPETSKYATIAFGAKRYFGEKMPMDIWYPVSEVELNGFKVMAPNQAQQYLKHRYGDYTKIPTLAEQAERMVRLKGNWKKFVASDKNRRQL